MKNPIVSVVMITYGHEKFIKKAIEGVLMQICDFEIELIISNDCSPDNTDNIINEIKEYDKSYSKINYIKHNQNIGMMANFIFTLEKAKGKYTALCEGDDYWTDPYKLQKQVDFLETNADYVGCFHKIKALWGENLAEDNEIEKRFERIGDKNRITRLDLLEHGNFIHTCSFMFRNKPIVVSNEMRISPVGDIMLFLELAKIGSLKRIDEYMAVYRRGTGSYSSLSIVEMCKKKLQYHMCILSSLTDEVERKLFLKTSIDLIEDFEKKVRFNNKSFFRKKIDSIKILIFKFIRKIYKK